MSLQDYYPSALAQLIQQAAVIKPKVVQSTKVTYLLTAHGQVLKSNSYKNDGKFSLFYTGPVQDILIDNIYHEAMFITLDANIIYKNRFDINVDSDDDEPNPKINDVISITSRISNTVGVITSNGNYYIYNPERNKSTLVKLSKPVVAQVVRNNVSLLLQVDGRVWKYETKSIVDAEDITSLSYKALLRDDGRIYELINEDFVLNDQIFDIIAVNSSVTEFGLYINLITKSGQVLRKIIPTTSIGDYGLLNKYKYKPVIFDTQYKAIVAVGTIIILDDGRVAQGEDDMTIIPNLNVNWFYD